MSKVNFATQDVYKRQGLDGVKVAVMGCVVNGPGEAKEADIGIAGGVGEGLIIKKGEILRKVPEEDLLNSLRSELEACLLYTSRCV